MVAVIDVNVCSCGKSPSSLCDGSHNSNLVCSVCGHVHDPVTEGNWWELPDDFVCPGCGATKDKYGLV